MKLSNFIIEGGNSVGKSTLLSSIEKEYPEIETSYSVAKEFELLREYTYGNWQDKSSLLYYLSSNIEGTKHSNNNVVVFDRSIISSFAMYLSRLGEEQWHDVLPLFHYIISSTPKVETVFHLQAPESVIQNRMEKKSGVALENDLKELEWEYNKNKARCWLLEQSDWNYIDINTENLTPEMVFEKVSVYLSPFIR